MWAYFFSSKIDNNDKISNFIKKMEFFMKKLIIACVISCVPLAAIAQANSAGITTIKLSHINKASSIKGKSAILFKEKFEAMFPAKIRVSVYEDSHLFKKTEEQEAMNYGVVDIIIPDADTVVSNYNSPDFEIFDLPFLFSNKDDVKKFLTSSVSQELLDKFNKGNNNVMAIGYLPEGFKDFAGTNPIKSANDLNGQTENTNIENNQTKSYIDKLFGINIGSTASLYELTQEEFINNQNNIAWLTDSNHAYSMDVILVNKKMFNSLSADEQKGLTEIAKEVADYALQNSDEFDDQVARAEHERKVQPYRWTSNEREAFKKAVIPVHANFLNAIDKNFLLEVYQAIRQK
jgi:C4-dicarboxylate-binding protein DctP